MGYEEKLVLIYYFVKCSSRYGARSNTRAPETVDPDDHGPQRHHPVLAGRRCARDGRLRAAPQEELQALVADPPGVLAQAR